MPWLFVAVAAWGALFTFLSYRPITRPPFLMGFSFFGAWLTTELALFHIAWQVAATVAFIALGALGSWPGWLGLAIALASWVALALSVRGALRTDALFARALGDESGRPSPTEWSRVWMPFHFRRRGVSRIKDIQYVDDGHTRHRLDIYRPAVGAERAPVLFQIHGGGWMISKKTQQALPLMYQMASQGWVCVAINYSLSPRATWPDHLVDCKRALAWVRAHITEYGGDPQQVVVTGGSAGGHLTAMMGLTANQPQWQPGFEDADTTVQGMVPIYGVYDWTGSTGGGRRDNGLRRVLERYVIKQKYADAPAVFREASPLYQVHADAPPALVIHGTLDTLAPVHEARRFVEDLRAVSRKPVAYVELRGAHHAFEVFNSIRALAAIRGISTFLETLVIGDRSPAGAQSRSAGGPVRTGEPVGAATDPTPTARTAP
ncbi:MAG TPA: alpha/beta hydrolase fold domain-containing protein [Acidimicrobiia bacterium]|nr:alpha/beta hydrolase fold domain-containing protein [Acidimicrobiia bacterium]